LSRSARLFDLLQALRGRRRPVAAGRLAEELGVSLRTVYRDIATLAAQGADIQGEAGLGYVLRPGFFLPPLMFDEDEADALLLGLRMVKARGDAALAQAAADALAKVEAVLPPEREPAAENGLFAGAIGGGDVAHLAAIRRAMRAEHKLVLGYRDKAGSASRRVVWPVAVGFFGAAEVLAAWCELRGDFRHFRLDRIETLTPDTARMPRRRRILLAEWRLAQALDDER
jgi:predicted DNA-binding transcriptional regulator YafY